MGSVGLLFPGQGSQKVGMGQAVAQAYAVAKQTFEEADDALGLSLSTMCFEGPEDVLRRTEITQPAILTTSVALYRVFAKERPDLAVPSVAAGHSLGEWSALVAVGSLSFADAVRAVHHRGRLMQEAVPEGEGAMAAVLGLSPEAVKRVCAEIEQALDGAIVRPANFNSPEQTVISGHAEAVRRAGAALKAAGASKIVPLPVSAPFHCPLMEPAAQGLAEVLATITPGPLAAPVVANVDAAPYTDRGRVRPLLVDQVTAPVRWVESVEAIARLGVHEVIELGPGKVLGGLVRRVDKRIKVHAAEDPVSLAKAFEALNGASKE